MARLETIPKGAPEDIERRTETVLIKSGKGSIPEIEFTRVKRVDGAPKNETLLKRSLAKVAGEQFGNTGLTIAQAAQAIADTCDRWAIESEEP